MAQALHNLIHALRPGQLRLGNTPGGQLGMHLAQESPRYDGIVRRFGKR